MNKNYDHNDEDELKDKFDSGKDEQLTKNEIVRNSNRSKTTVNLSWINSVKKISTSIANSRLFSKADGEIMFCCSVDGSKHSEYAFDFITENYMKQPAKLLCVHIFNSKIDTTLNYNNKKTTIIDKYNFKLDRFKKVSHFVTEDKISVNHVLEQSTKLAENYGSDFIICGYQGLKGPRESNKEQAIGDIYLLGSCRIPAVLIKEESIRSKTENRFRWLVVLDKSYSFTIRCLNAFLPLIDIENDKVDCIGYYNGNVDEKDVLKEQFFYTIEKAGISLENASYISKTYSEKNPIYKDVNQILNFDEKTRYDFVIIYNNTTKFRSEPESNNALNIITGTSTNVCFYNN